MSTGHQRSVDVRTLATQGTGALAIALVVNLTLGWVALSQGLVASTEFFRYPAIVV